ncbi:unnamed protein product [Fusarium venenatum]|uniref:Uncharacterized protein n=1 Tax=Fusarium venenatum TaxID=56646 RepID=A0A2L2TVM6_9HYPO|nr:uncharacterized protein FVRRES_00977 [Fusarium venenatum]CEI64465.1 unnamed protein product [Fusarium venenatum]
MCDMTGMNHGTLLCSGKDSKHEPELASPLSQITRETAIHPYEGGRVYIQISTNGAMNRQDSNLHIS